VKITVLFSGSPPANVLFTFSLFELLSQVLVEEAGFPVPGIYCQCLLKQTEGLSTLTLVVV
jgi:hypothetical protein